ncbi:hypothetical protein [Chryseobacterium cheonjiense]|jgi:hypothetical protein|uniref:Uncharacterized protein n=1 Tax=Chryseobacterium cheonjiense TaxID=2728845 RepID=A0A7Y0A9Y7_9FLAO|nr:hypothetical protein [Chryseobacterium cheonjiense]NML59405.1 hypothetical protein [Chryseobacterium cheonjiense]
MKKNILILLLYFCLLGCYSQKKTSDIIYFLPTSVTEILNKEVQKRGKESKVYVVLDKKNEETYILYLNNLSMPSENFWIENSNRSIFLEKRLIPLYFYTDEYFSFAEKGENVLKKLGTEENIKRVINIRENTFSVKFKLNGEIIK